MKLFVSALLIVVAALGASAQSPAELFGRDAEISDVDMSPSGNVIAFTQRVDGQSMVIVRSLVDGSFKAFDASADKLRGYEFFDDDHLVMFKSVTTRFPGYRGEYEIFGALSTNWKTGESHLLLSKERELLWPQTNLGIIIGAGVEPGSVLMPAKSGDRLSQATSDLFRVNLETGETWQVKRGSKNTRDWFVDATETVIVREEFSNRRNRHVVQVFRNNKWNDIFKEKTELSDDHFVGFSPDLKSLVVVNERDGMDDAVFHVSLEDGSYSEPVFFKQGYDIDSVFLEDGVAYGVRYSGLQPSYEFYDDALTRDMNQLLKLFPASSVFIHEVSKDRNNVLVRVEGNDHHGMFAIFHRDRKNLDVIAIARPVLNEVGYGKIETALVTARDGLEIPVIATYPTGIEPGSDAARSLPTVVMPHGGLARYDAIEFDEWAQFMAHKGYLVIQPNFRGSRGFGRAHRLAGYGKWGREMQDDVSDALAHYVDKGIVDPSRVCIAGGSYGGYSALAGGAFTPDLYKCVIAYAPVADILRMLSHERHKYGADHWVIAYWDRVIGDHKEARDLLSEISPANYAENFQAPVLLIHGDDDTVVPMFQSRRMEDQLKDAGKAVEFVKLKGEDHWLSSSETRIQAFEAMGAFLDKHLKAK